MLFRCSIAIALTAACRDKVDAPPPLVAIELRDAAGVVSARVVAGHPCRASVGGLELLVGGRPLVAQHGTARWTGEDGASGTALRQNDVIVARIHANQLFDGEGVPLVRVLPSGEIARPDGAIAARAVVRGDDVDLIPPSGPSGTLTVTHTHHIALAAMLAARDAAPEVRALAACHYLLP